MQDLNPRRWPRPIVSVLCVVLAVGALALLKVAISDVADAREREREMIANAVTTSARIVSEEPSCRRSAPARFGGAGRCEVRVEFEVPDEQVPVRTNVGGTGRQGDTVTVTYQADRPYRVLRGTSLGNRIPGEAYTGVVLSLGLLALAVTALRPLPDPEDETELHRTRSVVAVPLLFALTMAAVPVLTGLAWGIALVVGLPLLLAELHRWHDRLVIGVDEIRQRRWWRGTQRLVPDQRTTIRPGASWQAAGALVLAGPDRSITLVPRAWQHPARVADRLLRVLPAAGVTIPEGVAAQLWALRDGRRRSVG
ncbi:hypothetical protein [Salinilacustrithrix flava]|uniref:hypothetical protein n=1 Tax=Salinilacustrithrix flava TaxID=2957203 RepID=UPI003D7C2275